MKKNLAKIAAGVATGISTFYWGVLPAFAAPTGGILCPPDAERGTGIVPPGCGGTITAEGIIGFVLNLLLFVAFIAALVFLIIGGIKWIMSGGDKEGTNKAKETVTSALIGLAVVLAAWILINIVINVMTGGQSTIGNITVPKLVLPTK